MDEDGLSASDVLVLQVVREEGPVPRKEINESVPVADRTVGKCLSTLREDGFVERRPNPRDARGYVYESR
ncbi:MarR family transcriptional regulator [Halobacterium sp. CBA1126]|uniref:MarR family transcriptional regulator n=1 Tax=Halobacterium sp. CBA1126 TaxID=2668074 RepID=UPI0018D246A4